MTISEKFRESIENIREKISYDHAREPRAYYRRLQEMETENDGEDEEESSDDSLVSIFAKNQSQPIKTPRPGEPILDGSGSGSGAVAFLVFILIIIIIIVASAAAGATSFNRASEAEKVCSEYGLSSAACGSAQEENDVGCSIEWSEGKKVVECKEK
jgi:hypothetical protein